MNSPDIESKPYKGEIREVQITIQGAKGPLMIEQWNGFAWVPVDKVTKEKYR